MPKDWFYYVSQAVLVFLLVLIVLGGLLMAVFSCNLAAILALTALFVK